MRDLITIGECLVDLISVERAESLAEASEFRAVSGGAPTNVALTAGRLGLDTVAVGAIGDDGFGRRIAAELADAGVTADLRTVPAPTSVIVVTRTDETPDFLALRGADRLLAEGPAEVARWLHTSAFALSADPQRSTVLSALDDARRGGRYFSIDCNYHPRIWSEPAEPILRTAVAGAAVAKVSTDDAARLFGRPAHDAADLLLEWGAESVLVTDGPRRAELVDAAGAAEMAIPARRVVDVTGAGDAFLAGVIAGRLADLPPAECLAVAVEVAGATVEVFGHLDRPLHQTDLFSRAADAVREQQASAVRS